MSDEILVKLQALAVARFGSAAAALSADDDMFDKLGIDSLQALDLLTDLEEGFGIGDPGLRAAGGHDPRRVRGGDPEPPVNGRVTPHVGGAPLRGPPRRRDGPAQVSGRADRGRPEAEVSRWTYLAVNQTVRRVARRLQDLGIGADNGSRS